MDLASVMLSEINGARQWLSRPMDCGRYAVLPIGDLREHAISDACWCEPVESDGVVTHNSLDGREAFERGERKPS
jgi:hypothetical protein